VAEGPEPAPGTAAARAEDRREALAQQQHAGNPLGHPTGQTTSPTGSGRAKARDPGNDVVEFLREALAYRGQPSGFEGSWMDCSKFVQLAIQKGVGDVPGVDGARTTWQQQKWMVPVTSGSLQPGDVIFEQGAQGHFGHEVIYLGNNLVIAADENGNGGPVQVRTLTQNEIQAVGRVPGLVYDVGATGAQSLATYVYRLGKTIQQGGGAPLTALPQGERLASATGTTAPKHNTAVYVDRFGNRALRNPTNAEVYSAYERVQATMRQWHLRDPATVKCIYQPAAAGEDYNQINADIRKTPQYDAAFPGMKDRAKLGLPLMSETQYITYEHAMMGLATKYALPHGFISKREIGELVAHDVSPIEFNARLKDLNTVAMQADPLVKRQFEHYFGVKNSLGALTAYFANPNRATMILGEQLQAAEFGAQTRTSGLGPISKAQAMELAHFEFLHTPGAGATAIDAAANLGYLRATAPGAVAPHVTTRELLGAMVPGYEGTTQALAREQVRTAESAREAFLSAGGGFEATAKGVRGAGSASTEGQGP